MLYQETIIPVGSLGNVLLKAYCPDNHAEIEPDRRRPGVLICPGGGYCFRSFREDEPVALQLIARGFNAYVVEYAVAPQRFPRPQQDAGAAMLWIRAHADELRQDPKRLAILGFSAGGHLAASLGVLSEQPEVWEPLGQPWEALRPDAMVLCYPVITAGPYAHRGSFVALTGSEDPADHAPYSLEKLVTEKAPPAFLWHTWSDDAVPVQNSLLFASALAEKGVLAEMRIWPRGCHGLSLASEQTSSPEASADLVIPEIQPWIDLACHFLQTEMKAD